MIKFSMAGKYLEASFLNSRFDVEAMLESMVLDDGDSACQRDLATHG